MVHSKELSCIQDTCPKTKDYVNHITCYKCEYNPWGNLQPSIGVQLCKHPKAKSDPNLERWKTLKTMGGVFALTMTMG